MTSESARKGHAGRMMLAGAHGHPRGGPPQIFRAALGRHGRPVLQVRVDEGRLPAGDSGSSTQSKRMEVLT